MVYSIGRTRGRATADSKKHAAHILNRSPQTLRKRGPLTEELFGTDLNKNKNTHNRQNSTSTQAVRSDSKSHWTSPSTSPFSTLSSRTTRSSSTALASLYLKPAIDAMTAAVSFRARQGLSEFVIQADSFEFVDTILGHLRANQTYKKLCQAVQAHMKSLGFLLEIQSEVDLDSGLIVKYMCAMRHAGQSQSRSSVECLKDLFHEDDRIIID